eukprot:TRINITY_DN10543_c0_g2_i2.p1 TRINITY_DN10543_c0_g2~~TRINITY_DN10543_c0_g2_i2.p1  ORF type:complete len:221 (-),score=66.04 TRINITY_DN10543_c0_g2_i2:7-669(-)
MADNEGVTFNITFMDGQSVSVCMPASETVGALSAAAGKELGIAEHCFVKLLCEHKVLLRSQSLSDLGNATDLIGMVSSESDVKILKQAAGNFDAYHELIAAATQEEATDESGDTYPTVATKEFPNILEVLREMGGDEAKLEFMKEEEDGLLRYWGAEGEMLLPTLDTSELRKKLGVQKLTELTFSIGVNSDMFNRGLGVGREAAPQIKSTVDDKGHPRDW